MTIVQRALRVRRADGTFVDMALRSAYQAADIETGVAAQVRGQLGAVLTVEPALTEESVGTVVESVVGGRYRCRVKTTAPVLCEDGNTVSVSFPTSIFDIGDIHDALGAPTRVTIPAAPNNAGIWVFSSTVTLTPSSGFTGNVDVFFAKDGTIVGDTTQVPIVGESIISGFAHYTDDDPAAGSYYEVRVANGGTENILVNGSFNAHRIY